MQVASALASATAIPGSLLLRMVNISSLSERTGIGSGQVDSLLHLMRFGVHPRIVVLHPVFGGDFKLFELLDDGMIIGSASRLDCAQQRIRVAM